jgi:hypothetical protein
MNDTDDFYTYFRLYLILYFILYIQINHFIRFTYFTFSIKFHVFENETKDC